MKKQKLISLVFLGLIFIFLSGCFLNVVYNCDKLEKRIGELIKSENYCDIDLDCKVHNFSCPFGCFSLINKNADLSELKNEIEIFWKKCSSCIYDCSPQPDQNDIKCKNNKCVIKINENIIDKSNKQEINGFEKYIVASVPIEHELFRTVFPKVKFFSQTSKITMPKSERIIAKLDDVKYVMPFQYNSLFEKVSNFSEATVEDRLKLFALFTFGLNENIKSCKAIKPQKFNRNYLFNYKVISQNNELLFAFYHNKIFRVENFTNSINGGPVLLYVEKHSTLNGVPQIVFD
ncbi:hypothetical protein K8R66_03215 [bacterium]|nr:hypothetical protein [bacterium]